MRLTTLLMLLISAQCVSINSIAFPKVSVDGSFNALPLAVFQEYIDPLLRRSNENTLLNTLQHSHSQSFNSSKTDADKINEIVMTYFTVQNNFFESPDFLLDDLFLTKLIQNTTKNNQTFSLLKVLNSAVAKLNNQSVSALMDCNGLEKDEQFFDQDPVTNEYYEYSNVLVKFDRPSLDLAFEPINDDDADLLVLFDDSPLSSDELLSITLPADGENDSYGELGERYAEGDEEFTVENFIADISLEFPDLKSVLDKPDSHFHDLEDELRIVTTKSSTSLEDGGSADCDFSAPEAIILDIDNLLTAASDEDAEDDPQNINHEFPFLRFTLQEKDGGQLLGDVDAIDLSLDDVVVSDISGPKELEPATFDTYLNDLVDPSSLFVSGLDLNEEENTNDTPEYNELMQNVLSENHDYSQEESPSLEELILENDPESIIDALSVQNDPILEDNLEQDDEIVEPKASLTDVPSQENDSSLDFTAGRKEDHFQDDVEPVPIVLNEENVHAKAENDRDEQNDEVLETFSEAIIDVINGDGNSATEMPVERDPIVKVLSEEHDPILKADLEEENLNDDELLREPDPPEPTISNEHSSAVEDLLNNFESDSGTGIGGNFTENLVLSADKSNFEILNKDDNGKGAIVVPTISETVNLGSVFS